MKAKFGRYVFLKKLAVGGMAEIFLAKSVSIQGMEKRVAIKRGATIDQLVEVHGALRKGDLIVRRGSEELRPGTRIKPNVVAGR